MVLAWNPREAVALSGKCNNAIIRRFDFGRYFRPCGMGTTREHANGWRGTRGEVEEGISTRIKRTDGRLSRQRATSAIKPSRAVCKSTHCLDPKWHGVAGLVALSRALARPRLFCLIPRMTRLDASARVTLAFHDCLPDLFSLSFYSFRFFFPAVFCVSLLVEDDFTRFLRYVGVLWHGLAMLIEGSLFLTADPIFRFGLNFGELGWCLFVSCIFRIGAVRFSLGCVGCTFKI